LSYSYQASAGQSGANTTAGNSHQMISISGTIDSTTESAGYTYDLQKRLVTSSQTTNGASVQRRFAYDRWGNRTGMWDAVTGGNQIQTIALQQNGVAPTNRITSVTGGSTVNYTYDAAGNLTHDGAHAYTYDAENRVVSVDGGATAQYSYDHQNQRVKKVSGGATTHYIWEDGHVIAEHDGTAAGPWTTKVEYISLKGRMIATRQYTVGQQQSTAIRYYLSDLWGTRLAPDASGNVLGRQAHLPFGEEFAGSGTQEKHHFTSYEADVESATDYAVNRHYSQSVGRFGSADPYQASGYVVDPQSWNHYSYVQNDPIHNVDPLGLFEGVPAEVEADPCGIVAEPVAPKPEPAGECEISVRFKPLRGRVPRLFDGWHSYIVTTEVRGGIPSSVPRYYRAGPRGRFPLRINATYGDYVPQTPDFTTEPRPEVRFRFSGSCFLFDFAFISMSSDVNRRNLIYGIIRSNSNSFVYTLLKGIGLSISEQELDRLPIGWLPGWGQDLLG
ncbi:MAG: RHS repeat-associated core domain-containing protein, partial [Blastocatellia bacterium]